MTNVGIVLISHSRTLAEGAAELARQMGVGEVTVEPAGGTEDGGLGTSQELLESAVRAADQGAGVVIIARPDAARLAELTNTKGSSSCAWFQAGVDVSASRTAVYTASSGPRAAAPSPAGPWATCSTRRSGPSGSRWPVIRSASAAAAAEAHALKALRTHEPRLIGEVSLMTRSMFRKRSGLPRSRTKATAPRLTAARAPSRQLRHSVGRPVSCPPAASTAQPPATPPRKRYAATSQPHGAGLTTGWS